MCWRYVQNYVSGVIPGLGRATRYVKAAFKMLNLTRTAQASQSAHIPNLLTGKTKGLID